MKPLNGVDLSEHQRPEDIDYPKLARSIDFAILRVGYTGWGSGSSLHPDRAFKTHYTNLRRSKVPIGVYWYSCADTVPEAILEAQALLRLIKDLTIEYPVYIDTEDNRHQRPASTAQLSQAVQAFCEVIEAAGYYVGIYASASWFKHELSNSLFSRYDVWVAHYGVEAPGYPERYGIHQYTSTGKLPGYVGPLDLNRSVKDYATLIRKAGLNHLTPKPTNPVRKFKLNDPVVLNGTVHRNAMGAGPGLTFASKKCVITGVVATRDVPFPYHVNRLGWVDEKSLKGGSK